MLPRSRCRDPSTGRAGEQPGADEERLGDLLDGLDLLADGDRERPDTDRSAAEAAHQGVEHGAVEPVEAELVDVVHGQRRLRDLGAHPIPSARTSAKSRTRRSSRLAMRGVPRERPAISAAPSGLQGDAEQRSRAEQHRDSSSSGS